MQITRNQLIAAIGAVAGIGLAAICILVRDAQAQQEAAERKYKLMGMKPAEGDRYTRVQTALNGVEKGNGTFTENQLGVIEDTLKNDKGKAQQIAVARLLHLRNPAQRQRIIHDLEPHINDPNLNLLVVDVLTIYAASKDAGTAVAARQVLKETEKK